MKPEKIRDTNMSILYTTMHQEPIYQQPEIKEKPKKVERTSKSRGGHFDARG